MFDRAADTFEQLLRVPNPHLKYFENTLNGYVLLDITAERVRAEFWHVPFVSQPTEDSALRTAFEVPSGAARLLRIGQDAQQPG